MKTIGKITMIIAGLILCAHSFVPHVHHDTATFGEQLQAPVSSDSMLDYFQQALLLNHGEHHLEEYQGAEHNLIADINVVLVFSFEIPLIALLPTPKSVYTDNFIPPLPFQKPPLRGPPIG